MACLFVTEITVVSRYVRSYGGDYRGGGRMRSGTYHRCSNESVMVVGPLGFLYRVVCSSEDGQTHRL